MKRRPNLGKVFLPGSTIGILGSGQLGRMFALSARRMGYRVHTFSPDRDTPTGQVADKEWTASYDDMSALASFSKEVDVVTFEFENVPLPTIQQVQKRATVYPRGEVLHTTQQRIREKLFLSKLGIPVAAFIPVEKPEQLKDIRSQIKLPSVVKTAAFGYDGKGQMKLRTSSDVDQWLADMNARFQLSVIERFVDFEKELSVVAARGRDGSFSHFGVVENIHSNHILDITLSPSDIDPKIKKQALALARDIVEALDVVGVLCVEMFLTRSGELLVNELAPRPHNSGHFTIDACVTNQFEQQLRAICGLPLGDPEQLRPSAMVNLLGDLWKNRVPRWENALRLPGVNLHLYGKEKALPGRKMGHITVINDDIRKAKHLALSARSALLKP